MKRSIMEPAPEVFTYLLNRYRGAATYTRKRATPDGGQSTPATLPADLRREYTRKEHIRINAEELLTTPDRANEWNPFTGLQPLPNVADGLFYGNEMKFPNGKKVLSDTLILFSEDRSAFVIFLFRGLHRCRKTTRERLALSHIEAMRPHLPAPLVIAQTLF